MAIGYALEQFDCIAPPIPSLVVLIGHLCVLTDPRSLSFDNPGTQIVNVIFLISNILVFLYDLLTSMNIPLPMIQDMDAYFG